MKSFLSWRRGVGLTCMLFFVGTPFHLGPRPLFGQEAQRPLRVAVLPTVDWVASAADSSSGLSCLNTLDEECHGIVEDLTVRDVVIASAAVVAAGLLYSVLRALCRRLRDRDDPDGLAFEPSIPAASDTTFGSTPLDFLPRDHVLEGVEAYAFSSNDLFPSDRREPDYDRLYALGAALGADVLLLSRVVPEPPPGSAPGVFYASAFPVAASPETPVFIDVMGLDVRRRGVLVVNDPEAAHPFDTASRLLRFPASPGTYALNKPLYISRALTRMLRQIAQEP